MQLGAGSTAFAQVVKRKRVLRGHENVVAHRRVAAGAAHGRGEPGILDPILVRPDQKESGLWTEGAHRDAADHQPAAVIDAACEAEFAGNAIAAFDDLHLSGRLHRSRDGGIDPVRPNGVLRRLGEMADIVRMMDHQAGAPAVRGIGLSDFANHVEPGVEAQTVAAVARWDKNAAYAGSQQRIDGLAGQRAHVLGCRGALSDQWDEHAHPRQNRVGRVAGDRWIVLAHGWRHSRDQTLDIWYKFFVAEKTLSRSP